MSRTQLNVQAVGGSNRSFAATKAGFSWKRIDQLAAPCGCCLKQPSARQVTCVSQAETARVAVVIVNWEGWQDTVVCLASLDKLTVQPAQVVVVDNGSTDGSVEHMMDWLHGCGKNVLVCERRGRRPGDAVQVTSELFGATRPTAVPGCRGENPPEDRRLAKPDCVVVKLGTNCGFAAANNAGIDWLAGCGQSFDYYWFLNNDTRVDSDALGALLARTRRSDTAGMYGSVVLDEREPHPVQALGGGHYRGLTAQARHVGEGRSSGESWDTEDVERSLSYIYGASVLVSREFLSRVGPMCEDYFLYNEELDWAFRGRARGFTLGFADGSIVYHKGGASFARASGTKNHHQVRSPVSLYYLTRGAVIATWRWYPWALPCVLATRWGRCCQRFLRGQRAGARAMALALLAPWRLLLPEDLAAFPRMPRPGLDERPQP